MEPISPINSGASTAPQKLQPTNGTAAQPTAEIATSVAGATTTKATSASSTVTASATTSSSSVSLTSSSSNSTINQQVEGFLNSVSPTLANNQYLKLLIAALIMQVLLGDESSKQQTGQGGLAMLENLTGSRQNALSMSIESSTNTVQIQNESTRLDIATAVQSMSNSQNPTTDTGSQMDVSG